MMRIYHSIIIINFIIIIISCSKEKNNISFDNTTTVIKIDPSSYDELNISDFFSSIQLIPLETSEKSLMTDFCGKLIYHQNKFFIHDQKQHALFIFDQNGKFIRNTNSLKGDGPSEYQSMSDVNINRQTNSIEILDPFNKSIKIYNTDLQFIKKINLNKELLPLSKFKNLNDDLYLFFDGNVIKVYSAKTQKIIKLLDQLPFETRYFPNTSCSPFYDSNNSVYYTRTLPSSYLHTVDTNNISLKTKLYADFGKYNFIYEDLPQDKDNEFYLTYIEKNKDYAFILNKIETESHFIISFIFKNQEYATFYNKKTRQRQTIKSNQNKGAYIPYFMTNQNNDLFYLCSPSYIHYFIPESLIDNTSKNTMGKIKEDDNLVLMIYKLK